MSDRPELLDIVKREIRERGPMTFARFMDLALHHPEHGYYARGSEVLGTAGDFFTASDVGSAFGQCLARQLDEMDELLGRPDPFTVVELGGGRGLLARDVLDATAARSPALSTRMRYVIADASPAMRAVAVRNAPEAEVVAPDSVEPGQVGCAVAVELFDALPVHRVRRSAGRLHEIVVDLDAGGRLIEAQARPAPQVSSLAERYGAAPEDGDVAEVCPAAAERLRYLAERVRRGFVVIVDYGHEAAELYDASRAAGTLLAYHQHRTNEDSLERVGRQDLTAHVNFTALDDAAREIGFAKLGRTTQDRFLIALDILAPFEERDPQRWRDPARVRERLQILQLIHPTGMGRIFHVTLLSRGIEPVPRLSGLSDPFRREPARAPD